MVRTQQASLCVRVGLNWALPTASTHLSLSTNRREALHLLHSLRTLAVTAPVAVVVTLAHHHLGSEQQRRLFAR